MTFRAIAFLIGLFALSIGGSPAQAQNVNLNCWNPNATSGLNQWLPCNAATPLQIAGSISASLGGFTPSASGARGTPLTVTTSDSSGNLPTGTVVVVSNVGANPMYCNVNGVAATVSDQYISSSGGWFAFTIPAAVTTLHCIATGGSTTANTVGGSGLATGTGGGGGGGGGGSVTQGTVPWADNISQFGGSAVSIGQQLAAASIPVILPAATITTLTPPTTVTANLGTIGTAATAANQSSQLTQETTTATASGTPTDTPCTAPATQAGSCTMEALLKALLNTGQYPSGAVATNGSATGTTTATATTLAATVNVTQYACWISIRANATAAATNNATLSDGTKTFNFTQWTAPNASGLGVVEEVFNPCIPASAVNTAWTLTSGAPGTGGVVSVAIGGYKL